MDQPTVSVPQKWACWPLLFVLLFAAGLRIWTVTRSEVAARDSIGFIKDALRYEREPFFKVLRNAQQPPGYPLVVMATSWPVRAFGGEITPRGMALAAQLASAFFGVLLVIPMVGFGTELINFRFGIVAAALFQCLPAWVRYTSDGISESTFLFFTATALWLIARSMRDRSQFSMLGAGMAAGLAYLTRPEGAEIFVAAALVLLGLAITARWSWRQSGFAFASLTVGFLLFFGPFVAATGRVTNKPTGRFLLGDPAAEKSYFSSASATPTLLAVWWQESDTSPLGKTLWGVRVFFLETAASSRHIGLVLSIIGLFLWQRRIGNAAGGAVMMVLAGMHAALLIRMASQIGYLSERHTALIVLTGCYPVALTILEIASRCQRWQWSGMSESRVLITWIAVAFLAAVPSLAKAMHSNRAGHRAAGEWLAHYAPADAGIRDPFCWAQYYSGRDFHETASNDPDVQFVIHELSDNQHSRLPLIPEVKAKAAVGELVYYWPENATAAKAQVAVYRWQRPKSSNAIRPSTLTSADESGRSAAALP